MAIVFLGLHLVIRIASEVSIVVGVEVQDVLLGARSVDIEPCVSSESDQFNIGWVFLDENQAEVCSVGESLELLEEVVILGGILGPEHNLLL
jgi:hypothetical protein